MSAAPRFETPDEFIRRTGCLRRFENGQRVTVIDAEHPLLGRSGVVERVCIRGVGPWRMSDHDGTFWNVPEAWVRMDEPLPPDLRSFPADDPRGNNVCLYAAHCEDEARSLGRSSRRSVPRETKKNAKRGGR